MILRNDGSRPVTAVQDGSMIHLFSRFYLFKYSLERAHSLVEYAWQFL
jgi:hypothetical protein